jgi:hypothetical protein
VPRHCVSRLKGSPWKGGEWPGVEASEAFTCEWNERLSASATAAGSSTRLRQIPDSADLLGGGKQKRRSAGCAIVLLHGVFQERPATRDL